jgi:hypothetical protein
MGLLGGTQARIATEDEAALVDADALEQAERARSTDSANHLREMSARIDLAATLNELKAVGKQITPRLKAQMLPADVVALRGKYAQREAAIKGAAPSAPVDEAARAAAKAQRAAARAAAAAAAAAQRAASSSSPVPTSPLASPLSSPQRPRAPPQPEEEEEEAAEEPLTVDAELAAAAADWAADLANASSEWYANAVGSANAAQAAIAASAAAAAKLSREAAAKLPNAKLPNQGDLDAVLSGVPHLGKALAAAQATFADSLKQAMPGGQAQPAAAASDSPKSPPRQPAAWAGQRLQ